MSSMKPKRTLRESTKQHRPKQNTAEADKAALENEATKSDKKQQAETAGSTAIQHLGPAAQTPNSNPR
jgi:hypothetical protein